MNSLYHKIKDQNICLSVLINRFNCQINNKLTGAAILVQCKTYDGLLNELVEDVKKSVKGKLQFLPEYLEMFNKVLNMKEVWNKFMLERQMKKQNSIQNRQCVDQWSLVLKIGQEIQKSASFLLLNEDLQFLSLINLKGLSLNGIQCLRKQNIRKQILKYLTDEDVHKLGINLIGDILLLKLLIEQSKAS